MNLYEARWNNAKKIARKINNYLDKGYIVLDTDKEVLSGRFVITDNEVYFKLPGIKMGYFIYDKELDNGCYTTIKDYNKRFENWLILNPKYVTKLKL